MVSLHGMAARWGYSLTGPLVALSAKATGCTDGRLRTMD